MQLKNVAITDSYLFSMLKLDGQAKKQAVTTIRQLSENHLSPSLQIHSIDRVKCDPRFRSARVNDNIRVIFAAEGGVFRLLYVDRHDDAYDWCEGKFLQRTDFGAEYIYDEKTAAKQHELAAVAGDGFGFGFEKPLLEARGIKAKHLAKLGIDGGLAGNLVKISQEDDFIDAVAGLPGELSEALLDLAAGSKTFDEVYNELTDDEQSGQDPLTQKDSRRRFYLVDSTEELELLAANDTFERWKLFLHPSQEKLVSRHFNGPVLVEGGPGTGKTVVGIHRAVFLAQHVHRADQGRKILLCTYSKKLAMYIAGKVAELVGQKGVENNIDVMGADSYIAGALARSNGGFQPVNELAMDQLIDSLYNRLAPKGTRGFYHYEYHEVIERLDIHTLEEYLVADRAGMGMALDGAKRELAWRFFGELLDEKQRQGIVTFVDKAFALYHGLAAGTIQPEYDSIIIDEAQDLEAVKLKALCASVRTGADNILILSDVNQRIFRLNTWKKDVDVNIQGRSFYLDVNYRTTKQINDYARQQFVASDLCSAHIRQYKSIVSGAEPTVAGFGTEAEQLRYVVEQVAGRLDGGMAASELCVICPSRLDCESVRSALLLAGIEPTLLVGEAYPTAGSGVCVCPIQGVKGLEFEVVIMYNYNNIGSFLSDKDTSEAIQRNYVKQIECQKYVATTRSRGELIVTFLERKE